jgi:hypothetical protein
MSASSLRAKNKERAGSFERSRTQASRSRFSRRQECPNNLHSGFWAKDKSAREILKEALGRVQVGVASMTEYIKLYRPEHSWLHAFAAFRVPSPLSASDEAGGVARAEVTASCRRIIQEAKLREKWQPLRWRFSARGNSCISSPTVHPRAEWGRAAAELPEFHSARSLVELFFV